MSSNIKIRKNIIILFIQFLKKHSYYKIYVENLSEQKNIGIKDFLLKQSIYGFVANAFTWRETNQGEDFWLDVDRMWTECLINSNLILNTK